MNCQACGHGIEHDDALFCPNCAARLEREPEPEIVDAVPVAPGPETGSVPFEDTSRPFFERYWATLALSFSDPKTLFSNVRDGDLTGPVVYAVITGSIGAIFAMIWQMFFGGLMTFAGDAALEVFAFTGMVNVVVLVLMPAFVVVGLFLWAAVYHLCLLVLGTQSRGFGVTLRAVAYSYGPQLLAVIPFCGGVIGGIWAMVLTMLGGFYGHRTDAWRAVVGYFIPLLACCGLMTMLWFTIIGVAAAQGL